MVSPSSAIQNSEATRLGKIGGGIGYSGIPNSLAVEFDTWNDAALFKDSGDNHVAVLTRGTLANSDSHDYALAVMSRGLPSLQEGEHQVTIKYQPGTLEVSIGGKKLVAKVNLASKLNLDEGKAWVGLTAGTGALWENHDILNWSFTSTEPATSARFVLEQSAAPCYYKPNEPIVLVAGDADARYSPRFGQDGDGQPRPLAGLPDLAGQNGRSAQGRPAEATRQQGVADVRKRRRGLFPMEPPSLASLHA